LGRFANILGVEEWWDREHQSWTVQFPEDLKEKLMSYIDELVRREKVSSQGIVRKNWGKEALMACELYNVLKNKMDVEFQEGIIIWHIATDFFLQESGKEDTAEPIL
jgi:hypothetical protein